MELQQREAQSLPSIIVPGAAARFRSRHDDQPYGRSPAMSIPGSDLRQEAPPPLPPPRMPLGNPNDQAMSIDRRDYAQFTPSLSSGYGSAASSVAEERERLKRRVTGIKTEDHDEGYSSYSSWSSMERSRDAFPPLGFGLHHDRFQFQSPAGDVDSMKKKLDQMRPVDRSPPISSLSSLSSLSSRPPERYPSVLSMPHQLPFHPRPLEPSRMSEASSFSPRSTPFSHTGRRSPQESVDMDRSPRTRSSRNNSDDASVHGGYEYYGAEEMEIEETSSLKRLQLGDVCLAGQKRRAPSDDLLRRGEANPRGSPTPRLATISQGVPVPSLSRSSSYVSNISVGPSSAATYDRRSPRGQSPSGISPTSTASPYTTPKSLNPSPRGSISGRATGHHRNVSGASPRKIPEIQKPGLKMQGFFMCECCPKKPKKFETAEDLKAHEAEKQYNCQYCGNRFKNKNEAERHQNSLHVRRHSWSCSALKDYKRAFHESTSRPYEADTCGYCGEDFARSGRGPGGNGPRYVTERDWEERSRHLQDYHKFGECNTSKKFFRADHFRQHLKHSHAGASGKWTNMLETGQLDQVFGLFRERKPTISLEKSWIGYPSAQVLGFHGDSFGITSTAERLAALTAIMAMIEPRAKDQTAGRRSQEREAGSESPGQTQGPHQFDCVQPTSSELGAVEALQKGISTGRMIHHMDLDRQLFFQVDAFLQPLRHRILDNPLRERTTQSAAEAHRTNHPSLHTRTWPLAIFYA